VNKAFLEVIRVQSILLSRKSDQAIVEYIDSQRVVRGYQNVYTKVILETIDQMRVCHIL
jgi:hypothetical protein